MKIKIDDSIFHNYENLSNFKNLFYILCENKSHAFFCELENIEETNLFSELSDIEKEIICGHFVNFLTNSETNYDKTITNETSQYTYDLEEAIRYFRMPVRIVLENSLNDSYFLKALFKNFNNRSKKINRNIDSNHLIYEMAGGKGNIKNLLTTRLDEFNNLPKENHNYFRGIVIIDSDKQFPSKDSKNGELIDYLINYNISYHELEKREMENYMPDDILKKINDDFCNNYLKMKPIQKDYFDIEKGFKDINRETLGKEIIELFEDLPEEIYTFFRKNEFKIDGSFKSEFPKLFLDIDVNQANLKERVKHQDNPYELEEIIDKINQLL